MKKLLFVFSAAVVTFSLTAFAFINWNNSITDKKENFCHSLEEFKNDYFAYVYYNLGDRFRSTITKEELRQAKSITDILTPGATEPRTNSVKSMISILNEDNEVTEGGDSDILSPAQLKLIQSATYSSNIRITSIEKMQTCNTGNARYDSFDYYMTVIPEKAAELTISQDALIEYIRINSKEITRSIQQENLRSGKACFIVNENGTASDARLISTSGYDSLDDTILQLINTAPTKWIPAENSKGEKVEQELVLSFGTMGC